MNVCMSNMISSMPIAVVNITGALLITNYKLMHRNEERHIHHCIVYIHTYIHTQARKIGVSSCQ